MTQDLIDAIAEQERRLVLDRFDDDIAFALGSALRDRAAQIAAPVTIEIRSAARRYFFTTLRGATPENEDWGRRKINTVLRTHKSSMQVGMVYENRGLAQWPDMCLPYSDFAVAGGGFPVTVKDFGLVAAIGVSGLPSRDDHELSTATLAAHLGIKGIALP